MNEAQIANILAQIASVLLLVASIVFWAKRRTPWLLVMMIGSVVSTACRVMLALSPELFASLGVIHLVWPLASCVFSGGLLCHALLELPGSTSPNPGTDSPNTDSRT